MRREFTAILCLSLSLSPWLSATPHWQGKEGSMSLQISSTAFSAGETIPKKFTCDGPDAAPTLTWHEPPAKTQSFSAIMHDPDAPAGTWVHCVRLDLPAHAREL